MSAPSRGLELQRCHALLLAGGASSRFFPVNKIFSDLTGSGRSMIQQAYDRVTAELPGAGDHESLLSPSRVLVATGADAAPEIRRHLPQLPADGVLVEPEARSTLPALLWALAHVAHRDPGATVAVLTADHVIGDATAFRRCLALALEAAQARRAIVTIGIEPTDRPGDWTAFGAIRAEKEADGTGAAHRLLEFEEKPGRERAREMIAQGGWSWNSGMFVFAVQTLERALAALRPEMAATYSDMRGALAAGEEALAAGAFRALPRNLPHPLDPDRQVDNSIDYALMMPLTRDRPASLEALLVPASFPWLDLGSWTALKEIIPSDRSGNVLLGEAEARGTEGSILVAAPGRRIEAEGIRDTIVVHASDGRILVAAMDRAQEVKELARRSKAEPEVQGLFLDCRDCLVEPGEGYVAMLGLEAAQASLQDRTLRVSLLPRPAAPASPRSGLIDALATRPLALRPVEKNYAWGGEALPSFLARSPGAVGVPTAEAWLNSTHPRGPAGLVQGPLNLEDLIREGKGILGPLSALFYGQGLPVFAKFLSTRFPPRVRLGFARRVRSREFLEWLVREQNLLRTLRDDLEIPHEEDFRRYCRVWERWSIASADSSWSDSEDPSHQALLRHLGDHLRPELRYDRLAETLEKLRANRARIAGSLNRIEFEDEIGNLLLVPAGTVHGISGMSLQLHPSDPARNRLCSGLRGLSGPDSEFALLDAERLAEDLSELRRGLEGEPKEEAWIPIRHGEEILVAEVQQLSDDTFSLADFHTPFAWHEGRLVFRKGHPRGGIPGKALERHLEALDFEPRPVSSYRRRPHPLPAPPGSVRATMESLLADPADCPYFCVYRLVLEGSAAKPARWVSGAGPSSFLHLVVTGGAAELKDSEARCLRLRPGAPAFVPYTCPPGFSLTATEPTTLLLITTPLGSGPGRAVPSRDSR